MYGIYHSLVRRVDNFDTQDWTLFVLVAVGIGFVCMRGFGSRSSY